jgi:hypothetical protein
MSIQVERRTPRMTIQRTARAQLRPKSDSSVRLYGCQRILLKMLVGKDGRHSLNYH